MRDSNDEYSIREVYSDQAGDILGWTQRGQHPWGETPDVLREILGWMLEACDRPILDEPELERQTAEVNERLAQALEYPRRFEWAGEEVVPTPRSLPIDEDGNPALNDGEVCS